jgi:hypothetical protein
MPDPGPQVSLLRTQAGARYRPGARARGPFRGRVQIEIPERLRQSDRVLPRPPCQPAEIGAISAGWRARARSCTNYGK